MADCSAGVPFGEPLAHRAGTVWWGAWERMEDRPVLATGGVDEVRLRIRRPMPRSASR
jgi:hypothetical protein